MDLQKILTTFYIVRHGEAESNEKNVLAGQLDFPLTSTGHNQAQERARHLDTIHFDAAFSSDLARAKQTTEIIALQHKLIVKTRRILRERHFGTFQGKDINEIRHFLQEFQQLTQEQRWQKRLNPLMETSEEIVERFILFLRETAVAYPAKTILVGCHGDLMITFLDHIGYKPYAAIRVNNTGYFILESDGIDFFVKEIEGIEII